MPSQRRPVLRYHGGKWRLAPWIIAHFPPHRVYTEAFGGAASVLLRKPRSFGEIYNDLDDDVVNLFRVLRSPDAGRLIDLVALTPFARAEFEDAFCLSEDRVERARRLVTRSFLSFGSNGHNRAASTGFRANANRNGTHPARDFTGIPNILRATIERLAGVVIENRPAAEILRQHDSPETLHYVDPPYLHETRSAKVRNAERAHSYVHEMTRDDHAALLSTLRELRGMVILSGYPSPLYDQNLPGWRRVERAAMADGAQARREVLWINPVATQSLAGRLNLPEPADA